MNKPKFFTKPYQFKVKKPWGYEIILTPPESLVTGKIIHLKNGCRFSLQYHDKKEEILTLIFGEAIIFLEDNTGRMKKIKMTRFKGYFIRPFQKHRCQGIKNCFIMETSTKEKGKTVRLEDDYNRGVETEESRKKRNEKSIYLG